MVSPGEVRLSNNVISVERKKVPLGGGGPATDTSLVDAPTVGVPSIPGRRSRAPMVVVAVVLLALAGGAGGYALWSGGVGVSPSTDAGAADLVSRPDKRIKRRPRPRPRSRPEPPRKMTPEEADRLVEWARRAADSRRYVRPPGDNLKELLARVEKDCPDHPSAARLHKQVLDRLDREYRRALRRKHYTTAERRLRAWSALEPEAKLPQVRLTLLFVAEGQRALARRKFRSAHSHAKAALRVIPDSASALELMGDIARSRRRYPQALKHYELALEAPAVGAAQKRRLRKKIAAVKRKIR